MGPGAENIMRVGSGRFIGNNYIHHYFNIVDNNDFTPRVLNDKASMLLIRDLDILRNRWEIPE